MQLSAINDFTVPAFSVKWLRIALYIKRIVLLQFAVLKVSCSLTSSASTTAPCCPQPA